jgi:hypothetical protein
MVDGMLWEGKFTIINEIILSKVHSRSPRKETGRFWLF